MDQLSDELDEQLAAVNSQITELESELTLDPTAEQAQRLEQLQLQA